MSQERIISDSEIQELLQGGRQVVVLFGAVYDLTDYYLQHPGGKEAIINQKGKDATEPFVKAGHLTKGRVVETLAKFRLGKYSLSPSL